MTITIDEKRVDLTHDLLEIVGLLKDVRAARAQVARALIFYELNKFISEARATSNDRWPEILAYYSSVKYLNSDPVDEFIMLAKQLIKISSGTKKIEAQAELDKTFELLNVGDRSEAARHAVRSYQILYY